MQGILRWMSRPFFVFTVFMVLKINLSWLVIFGAKDTGTALLVSVPSVWVVFGLIELLAKKRKILFYMIANFAMTSVYFAAIMYYKYYGVIVNYRALQQAKQVVQVKSSVFDLMHPYYLLIYLDVVVLLVMFLFSKNIRGWGKELERSGRRIVPIMLAASLLFCLATIWMNRGIVNEIKQAEQMGILNYQVYTVLADMKKEELDPPDTIDRDEIRTLKGIASGNEDQGPYWSAAKDKNIVIIQLESFQNFLIGLTVDGHEVTPVLNRLAKEAYYFPHMYQQAGQGNTSDAEFITNTSFYIPPNGAAADIYTGKDLPSLPKLVREHEYKAFTFHTNDVTFWNRNRMYPALGFTRYYDRAFFGEEDQLAFGASDEVLYAKTAAELAKYQEEGQKFYAHVISMSAHHPYDLPEDKYAVPIPDEMKDTLVGNYLRAQSYADAALGQFIEELKQSHIWENSMIVIYGDHLGLPMYSLNEPELAMLRQMLGRDYSYTDMLNIPLIVSVPDGPPPQAFDQVGGQVDIMPTVAHLAGMPMEGRTFFGQNLLNNKHNILPERYYLPSGSFINDEGVFIPGEGVEDGDLHLIRDRVLAGAGDRDGAKTDEELGKQRLAEQLERYRDEYERALQLLHISDSYVKQLPDLEN
ncbi:Lipoteichoic acid synthase [Paenibacillus sp. CECT 9249]|uniref:LTA synthase family protein n=1 Tax=Paenibacillus sp. CECT 9249 TaxID=2845385 RepID=UPI001EF9C4F7|nr:Lipoteichoic acid synthase [Paenibacillus sp. CECT 9249]